MSDPLKTSFHQKLSREELLDWASENLAFYHLPMARISTVFLVQAHASEVNRVFNTFDITHPIKVLEGLSKTDDTPAGDQFKDPILLGLSKKHFSSARFIPRNLSNFLQSKFGTEYFQKIFDEAAAASGTGYVDDIFTKYLAHHITIPPLAMRGRARKSTGEWVVFYTHEGLNYYLCLGFHGKGARNQEANQMIRDMADLACELDNLPFRLPPQQRQR